MTSQNTAGGTNKQANEAHIRITGKRRCSHHQGMVASDDGSMVLRGKITMFMCSACQIKRGLK